MHLFGFIIRIFHDARSPERQNIFNTGNLSGFKNLKYSYCKIKMYKFLLLFYVSRKKKLQYERGNFVVHIYINLKQKSNRKCEYSFSRTLCRDQLLPLPLSDTQHCDMLSAATARRGLWLFTESNMTHVQNAEQRKILEHAFLLSSSAALSSSVICLPVSFCLFHFFITFMKYLKNNNNNNYIARNFVFLEFLVGESCNFYV